MSTVLAEVCPMTVATVANNLAVLYMVNDRMSLPSAFSISSNWVETAVGHRLRYGGKETVHVQSVPFHWHCEAQKILARSS
eukprot:2216754-Amphidinium_carterae.1